MKDEICIDEYQTIIDGDVILVKDLTLEQAQRELCLAMDCIDAMLESNQLQAIANKYGYCGH